MASEFGADLEPITLCLRDSSDALVTRSTLSQKVRSGEKLRQVNRTCSAVANCTAD